jgi:predicted branched-subunit amino acid permease
MAPHFAHLKWPRRLWLSYFNSDIAMALFPQRFPAHTAHQTAGKVGFYNGIGYLNWLVWQTGSVTGILLARQIPQSWGIGFAGTLALLAVMVPLTINMAALVGVIVAGAAAVLANGLPYRLGLLVAVLLGMAAAMAADTVLERKAEQ